MSSVAKVDQFRDLVWAAGLLSAAALIVLAVWSCVDSRHCAATEFARVKIGEYRYRVPVRLRPNFDGRDEKLLSYSIRDESGHWVCCQKPSELAVKVKEIILDGVEFTREMRSRSDLKGVTFLSVGKSYVSFYREPDLKWSRTEVAGLKVVRTKGTTDIIDPGRRYHASCSTYNDGNNVDGCRVYLNQVDGTSIMFDISEAVPTSRLPAYVASIEAYVKGLRDM